MIMHRIYDIVKSTQEMVCTQYNYAQNIQYCEENHEEQYLRWDLQLRQCKKYAKGCSDEVMKTYTTMHQKNKKSTHIQKQSSDEQSNPPTAMALQLGEFFVKQILIFSSSIP